MGVAASAKADHGWSVFGDPKDIGNRWQPFCELSIFTVTVPSLERPRLPRVCI